MRKHAIILITLALTLFLLAACNQDEAPDADATSAAQAAEATPTQTPSPTPTLPATYTPSAYGHGGHLYAVDGRGTHIVKAGETMSIIANMYGITVEALARANRIYDYDHIEVGQVLFVPPCE